jgi:hypothetical protein
MSKQRTSAVSSLAGQLLPSPQLQLCPVTLIVQRLHMPCDCTRNVGSQHEWLCMSEPACYSSIVCYSSKPRQLTCPRRMPPACPAAAQEVHACCKTVWEAGILAWRAHLSACKCPLPVQHPGSC